MANSFLRTQLHGQTPLQTAALAALRSECKHPALFDEVIGEMCRDIVDQSREKYSDLVSALGSRLQLEHPTGMSITQEVERLVADIQKLVVDEEETLQKAERDLCARFLALIETGLSEPEDFTPERVDDGIKALREERDTQKQVLIHILGEALAKKLPDGREELTVLDAEKPWQDFAHALLDQVKAVKEERDALIVTIQELASERNALIKERDTLKKDRDTLHELINTTAAKRRTSRAQGGWR